jgi:hypothetical protein
LTIQTPQNIDAVDRVTSIFSSKHRFSREIAVRAEKLFGEEWTRGFGETIDVLYGDEKDLEAAIKGYTAFAMDSMRRQKKFELERKYVVIFYAQAAEGVYLQ